MEEIRKVEQHDSLLCRNKTSCGGSNLSVLLVTSRSSVVMWMVNELKDRCSLCIASERFVLDPSYDGSAFNAIILDSQCCEKENLSYLYSRFSSQKNKTVFVVFNRNDEGYEKYYFEHKIFIIEDAGSLYEKMQNSITQSSSSYSLSHTKPFETLSNNASSLEYFKYIQKAISCDETVLLLGESGSGKDYAAQYIHKHSARKDKPFCKINLSGLNAHLVESELFGVERGAYTGALERDGLFAGAEGGTIFLNEVGDLPVEVQLKLLDVLDTFSYRRVGGTKEHHMNVRFIFATDADLTKYIDEGRFRKQLYYRMAVLKINVPPLRARPYEIAPLALQFVREKGKVLSKDAITKLCDYDWPGNIRQLRNCIYRACACSASDEIQGSELFFD